MTGNLINGVLERGARGQMYRRILVGLDAQQLATIRTALDERIEGNEIVTAGWLPGSDWRGTPYQAIYEGPAQHDHQWAGLMFGLLVWEAFERHEDRWFTGKFELNGIEIGSRTYWRPNE